METTYTVKPKKSLVCWSFKYDLNGDLVSFNNIGEKMSDNQLAWLFSRNFPVYESVIKNWNALKEFREAFEIMVGEPDLSFEAFYKAYRNPVKKMMAERAWERLSKADRRNAIAHIKTYDNYLQRKNIAKAHPSTYLNQRYWEDNHGQIA